MTSSRPRAAVILAAGQGTRMRSPIPKVLHRVGHRAMVDHAIDAALAVGCERVVVVVGVHSPEVRTHVEARLGANAVAVQDPPLGTGHAVLAARQALADFDGDVVVTYGDVPLLKAADMESVFGGDGVTVLGFEADNPGAYGRLRMSGDRLDAIVEAKEADQATLSLTLCNSGVMAAPARLLFDLLDRVENANAKGEYYLTDVVALARDQDHPTRVVTADERCVMGVNAQAELAEAEAMFQSVRRDDLMAAGVTLVAPETVHLAWDTQIGAGTVVEPYVVFGPGVHISENARIAAFSHLEGATIASGARVGPYARLRPGADLGEDVRVGNFVEVKAVRMEPGAKANHLAYLGDGHVGRDANIGAGTIFCNYDGVFKHRTKIGDRAFVGSNSALVAPVEIGEGAMVGSGSVVTRDVGPGDLALGRAAQVDKPGWADRFMKRMREKKAGGR